MSKERNLERWEKYRVDITPTVPDPKRWEKYRVYDDMMPFLAKSAVKGVTDIADLPANLAHLAERGGKKALEFASEHNLYDPELVNAAELPVYKDPGPEHDYFREENVDRPSKWVKAGAKKLGINNMIPYPDSPMQHMLGQGMEFATSSLVPGSAFVKGGTGILGRLSKGLKAAKGAAPIGMTSAALEESGVRSPLVASLLAIPTAAGIGKVGNTVGKVAKAIRHPIQTSQAVARKVLGLTPEEINLPALKATKDLGIDLPASAFTASPIAAYSEHAIQRMPGIGNKIKETYNTANDQVKQILEDIYNKTGPERTPEIIARRNKLYEKSAAKLPKGAAIEPLQTIEMIESIKNQSIAPTATEKEVYKLIDELKQHLNPTLESKDFGKVKLPIQPQEIERLIATKRSLNAMIKWDIDEGVRNKIRQINHTISKDIKEYGKLDPKWYETFKKAEGFHAKIKKREKLEQLLGKSTDYGTDEIAYNRLSKTINTPKDKKLIEKQLTPENFKRIEGLREIAKAIALKNKHAPNPSGTATTAAALAAASSLITNPIATTKVGLPILAVGKVGSDLLTSKKFLESALMNAEHPNLSTFSTKSIKDRLRQGIKDTSLGILGRKLTEENKKERRNATFKNAK
jgi:hypothetical protein